MIMTMMTDVNDNGDDDDDDGNDLIGEQNYSDEAPMDTCIEKFFFTKVFQAFQAKLINF